MPLIGNHFVKLSLRRVALALLVLLAPAAFAAPTLSPSLYEGLHWRQIGPFRGGRAPAVAGVASDPNTYYFGAAAGGVWKTTDSGVTWRAVFAREPVSSIGAIAVAPSAPNVVYVGTGEADPRNDTSFGDGMYKSTNGGATWKHIGLSNTRHIGDIVVDPQNPDIVLVAALGHVYGPNTQRGVFRSTDGGQTWRRVLYVNNRTGATDLAIDPANPNIIYAAMWSMYRTPWHLESGGPGSGLFKSTDGGKTWIRLQGHGLPTGPLGRIGIAVAAGGQRVYALIQARRGGLYRSDDRGAHWKLINDDQRLRQRAWYFSLLKTDPQDPDTVYVGNVHLFRSTNGGKWFGMVREPHPDNHALWIDPNNPQRMILGEDGGAAITTNGGASWTQPDNQPTAQFYHVAADNQFPYHIYGSQQDWGSVDIASATSHGAITEHDWHPVGGGESGYVLPSPADPNIVYAGSYFGILTRYNKRTGQVRDVSPWPVDTDGQPAEELEHRFTWTAPLAFSPQNPQVLYTASQVLMKTTDGGTSWHQISPDLTRDDQSKQGPSGGPIARDNSSAEYYDLIFSIAPSPNAAGEIWVGTDDGLVQLTRDGGKTWHNVTPPGLPKWAKVAQIQASPFDAGTAYVAVDAHKLNDVTPYIFRTRDYGRHWTKITTGIKAPAYVHVVREDPHRRGLLFAGTETGVYVSFDDGDHWQSLQLNLPSAPVHDLIVHAGDLIVATHGRGFWVLDDISPLEQVTPRIANAPAHLFAPAPAYRVRETRGLEGSQTAAGSNPRHGAMIDYYLAAAPDEPITLTIRDSQGRLVRRFTSAIDLSGNTPSLPSSAGMHRFVWNLHYALPPSIPGAVYDMGGPVAPLALPGTYQVTLNVDGRTWQEPLTVKMDPRVDVSMAALKQQFNLMMKLRDDIAADHRVVNQISDLRDQVYGLQQQFAARPHANHIVTVADQFDNTLATIADSLWQPRAHASQAMLNYPARLNSKLAWLERTLSRADAAPTKQEYAVYRKLHGRLQTALDQWRHVQRHELAALNLMIGQHGFNILIVKDFGGSGGSTKPARAIAE
ncbi:MAG TPA: glycosyl hydrolase [Gammaproteobacteria bacterium]|nr:glycosyl hydrolase [Gammaproteobacteria bacterium]